MAKRFAILQAMTLDADPPLDETFIDCVTRLCGEEAARLICEHFGGLRLFVPVSPEPAGRLAQVVGLEAAQKISAERGGEQFSIPLGAGGAEARRMARVRALILSGLNSTEIIREVGVSRRTVSNHRSRLRQEGLLA